MHGFLGWKRREICLLVCSILVERRAYRDGDPAGIKKGVDNLLTIYPWGRSYFCFIGMSP
tara:strand:+ start:703 stop:882 length:180 start_codon:yes stop_codon:yes gene_type:complete